MRGKLNPLDAHGRDELRDLNKESETATDGVLGVRPEDFGGSIYQTERNESLVLFIQKPIYADKPNRNMASWVK